ncbi:hypothetical protein D3C71_1221830 [compost metagenome]
MRVEQQTLRQHHIPVGFLPAGLREAFGFHEMRDCRIMKDGDNGGRQLRTRVDLLPARLLPCTPAVKPGEEDGVQQYFEPLMVPVLVSRLPIDVGMEVSVQQMMRHESGEVGRSLLPLRIRKLKHPVPEFHQDRPAVGAMNEVADETGLDVFFPREKTVVIQQIRSLTSQLVQLPPPLRSGREQPAALQIAFKLSSVLDMHPQIRHLDSSFILLFLFHYTCESLGIN